jgi:hypothetical protein
MIVAVVEKHQQFWRRHVGAIIAGGFALLLVVIVAGQLFEKGHVADWLADAPEQPAYVLCGLFVWFDAVIPIFPGETTLSAASTLAARGDLNLQLVMVAGALGAILGDSSLFWIARKSAAKMKTQRDKAARETEGPRRLGRTRPLPRSSDRRRALCPWNALRRQRVHRDLRHPLPPLLPLVGPRRSSLVRLHVRTRLQGGNDARRLPARVARDLLTDHVRRVGGGLLRGPSQEKKSKDRGAGNPVEHARRGELSNPRGTLTFEAAEQSGFELIPSM